MTNPIYPQQQGSTQYLAASGMPASTLANNAISGAVMRITRASYGVGPLLMDVFVAGSFGTDPAGAGALQLIRVDRSPTGDIGPVPVAATARNVFPFAQGPQSTSGKIYSVASIPVPIDCDLYLYNNATGYTFTYTNSMNSSADAFAVYLWTPGS